MRRIFARVIHTHLPDELLDSLVNGIGGEVELGSDPLCLLCEGHAALGSGIEGANKFNLRNWLGASLWFLKDDWIAESDGWGLVWGEGAEDRVREVRCKEL